MTPVVELLDWGVIDYAEALGRQRELFERLVAAKCGGPGVSMNDPGRGFPSSGGVSAKPAGWLIMCQHPPVYTLGRSGRVENLLVSEEMLRERGAALHRIERGGDITFHGPGQLVVYPILDLDALGLGLRAYVEALEQSVIETVAGFGIEAGRIAGKTGVWVGGDKNLPPRKICAIGVKASRGVVMHGLALNVATDLGWFELINPCGFVGGAVTSIERETGRKTEMAAVKKLLGERLKENLKIII
jgi:lipoyl(octanoyl) transferase